LLQEGIAFFGSPYPRDQAERQNRLSHVPGRSREEWDPFFELDERFFKWLEEDADRWERAADAYATRSRE
jgi:hypothetical protein